jgi:hypothetical protein
VKLPGAKSLLDLGGPHGILGSVRPPLAFVWGCEPGEAQAVGATLLIDLSAPPFSPESYGRMSSIPTAPVFDVIDLPACYGLATGGSSTSGIVSRSV